MNIDPFKDKLSPVWRGWWTTSMGEKIHASMNFALYWEVLHTRQTSRRSERQSEKQQSEKKQKASMTATLVTTSPNPTRTQTARAARVRKEPAIV